MKSRIVASAIVLGSLLGGAFTDGMIRNAHPSFAAALPVSVEVTDVSINNAANTYTESIALCVSPCSPADTSGLSNFSESWTGPGTTPRYTIGASATIDLP